MVPTTIHEYEQQGDEALEQVAQRSCGCYIPGGVQGQAGWGFEQPVLAEGVHVHGKRVGTKRSLRSLPTPKPFYDSMISCVGKLTDFKGGTLNLRYMNFSV